MATLVQMGCKKCLVFLFLHGYCYDNMFLQQYLTGHEIVICDVLTNSTMIWDHNLRHFRLCNHIKLSKHVFL